jgi:hypothetical protein
MFLKRTLLAGLIALSAPAILHAQTHTLDGIANMRRSALSPIFSGNEVSGYVMFARGDKADRKNDNYLLDLYDQNLTKVSTITIQKPAGKYSLLKNTFNGTAFAFYFYNAKDKTLEIETYDTSLKKLGTKAIGELTDGDKFMLAQGARMVSADPSGSDAQPLTMIPVPGTGFLRNGFTGNGMVPKGYTLALYDDKLAMKWRITSDEKSKQLEALNITEVADKYLLGTMMRRSGMMSKTFNTSMVAIETTTGKKIIDLPVETTATENLSLSSFTFDAEKREFVAIGEYYKLDDKPYVNKSLGFYIKRFNEQGKPVSAKNYGWQKEVMTLMPAEAKASLEENFVNYNHTIVKGANGKLYIVAEQFKVVADGLGIAVKALGGSASVTKGKVGNLLIFELDPQANLSNVKFYPKTITNAEFPPGAGFLGTSLLGSLIKARGDFDFQFLERNAANTQFNVIYINFDKEKGEDAKGYIGDIAFGDNGKYAVDKIALTGGASYYYLYPAKPGYVLIADYYKKKSQLGMKLIKLNI